VLVSLRDGVCDILNTTLDLIYEGNGGEEKEMKGKKRERKGCIEDKISDNIFVTASNETR
jgi:hypothetical protein